MKLADVWERRHHLVPAVRKRLRRRVPQLLLRLPGGTHLHALRMRQALASGSLEPLVPVEALGAYYRRAIAEVRRDDDTEIRYFEAGVYCGQSMAVWFDACAAAGVDSLAFGADSFRGLPESVRHDEGSWYEAMFWCPRSVAEWNMERLGVPAARVELIEGYYDETLGPELAQRIGSVNVAMLDADAYSSTVPVLEFLGPILSSPSVLVFDDWYSGGNLDPATGESRGIGVERAFDEWLRDNPTWSAVPTGDYHVTFGDGSPRPAGRVFRLADRRAGVGTMRSPCSPSPRSP